MIRKPKVYLGIPRERFMFTQFFDNLIHVMNSMKEVEIDCGFFVADGHRVDRNRDRIVEKFLEHEDKPDYLLMLDTDMEHPLKIAERLVSWEKDIIGGLYFHRFSHKPFVMKYHGTKKDKWERDIHQWSSMNEEVYEFLKYCGVPKHDGSLAINLDEDERAPYGPLLECDAVASGAMLIHRRVFEAMKPPWFEYKYQGVSEDLQFCMEAKKEGFKVFCDLSSISGHFAIAPEGYAQFMVLWEGLGIQAAYLNKDQATELLADFWGISKFKAGQRLVDGTAAEVGKVWNKKLPKTATEVNEFYKAKETGNKYIIELLHWNNSDVFTTIRDYIRAIRGREILEVGSGIGTVALQLALQDNNIIAVEPNEQLRNFTNLRIKKIGDEYDINDIKISLLDKIEWWEHIPDSSFDIVVCFDVFEHMPEEVVRKNLLEMHRVLNDHGRLIYHANFAQQDLYPMHFDYTDKWDQWLAETGFAQLNPLEALKVDPK